MLTIVKVVAATLLGIAGIAVNRDDLAVVALVFVGDFEDIPGIGVSGRVGEPLVVVDDLVQGLSQALCGGCIDCLVIALRFGLKKSRDRGEQ
jgi:hypothetical protein